MNPTKIAHDNIELFQYNQLIIEWQAQLKYNFEILLKSNTNKYEKIVETITINPSFSEARGEFCFSILLIFLIFFSSIKQKSSLHCRCSEIITQESEYIVWLAARRA